MADLGNLKILLDMATTGNLKDILEKTDKKLEKLREKASTLQLGFDDKSFSSLVTKMNDVAESMQGVSKSVGQKMVEGMKQSAEESKGVTTEMKAQVTLSSDLEALFKEMAGTIRTIAESHGKVTAAKKASVAATKEGVAEEQKSYDITRLRQKAEEKNGQLAADEVAVLKQMESIEKALIAIDEKHSTHLADQLKKWMHYDGVTKEQLGTYQALITRMQAAMQVEQRAARQKEETARKEKQSAKEREAAFRRVAQLESALIRIDTQLLGLDQSRFQEQTKLLLAKKQNGTITREEANVLSTLLVKEKAMVAMEEKKAVAASNTAKHFGRQSTIIQQINSYLATYVSVIGAVNLIRNLVRITGEFEAQHVALRAILQDVAGADRIFYQLQELAVKSPFTFRNLTDYAKQLSAFSVPMNEIYDTTKRLADVSAGLGVDMSRIILAYGQIRSASFLRGQEVRQLTEAGIPVLQELAKQFSEIEGRMISAGEVFDRISARQVPFEMIEKMFKDLTSAGGKFYQMQEVLAETVKGKISNLQDAWEIMLSKIGDANSGTIKKAISTITEMLQNYETLIPALKAIALSLVTIKSVTGVANTIQNIRIALINKETRALLLQKIAINGVAAALGIGVGIVTYFIQKQRQANEEATELSRSMDSLSEDFRKIFSTFAVSWRGVEKAYERISNERHNAYKRALKENEGMLPNVSEAAKKLIEDSNKVVGPIETIKRKTQEVTAQTTETLAGLSEIADSLIKSTNKVVGPVETIQRKISEMSLYGGELEAAVVVADKSIKQLVSDGGELDAALVSVSRSTKQLTSDGGELNAAIVTADAKVKQLVSNGGELEAAMVTAHKKVKQLVSDGGELEAALVSITKESSTLVSDGGEINAAIIVAEKKIKQLISDGGELDAAMITVDRDVKQLVSDGGELNAAVVTAVGKTLPKLNAELAGTVKATKELGLVGEPVRKSQKDIERQFNASKKSTEEYEAALNELYEKYPNFIDKNVRQKIAVEDLAGAWDLATQNMRQYYAEQATQQAHSILQKGYDKQTNDIITNLNAELRTGKKFEAMRESGELNEGAIQLIDAYVMRLKTREELSEDIQNLIDKINATGKPYSGPYANSYRTFDDVWDIIDTARSAYGNVTDGFLKAVKESDKAIETDFTSAQHKKVTEYLLGAGLTEDSELMMKHGERGFETWEQWQERLREMYKKTADENQAVIEKMFSHFGLVVNPNELTPVQTHIADWMKANPAPAGVSLPGLEIKPETSPSKFAEDALKMMQEDEKELARLPKAFQKQEEQSWDEYAEMLDDMGAESQAMIARRRKYIEELSQGVWGDDVFGSTKELAKKKRQSDKDYQQFIREQLDNLRQQFQNLKEIKSWYDRLTKEVKMSDTDASRFLASFGVRVPATGFDAAFDNLSAQFIKYGDKNTAQDVQNFKNGRELKSDIDSMIASAKAIEKYTEALKDLEAQTRRLNLSGFAQELDKIIVDADSKNRQLETNWAQKAEALEKAKDGWIQRYRIENEKATQEEALRAWEGFYKKQTDIAEKAMDTQREYNRKVAQEQINDKASKWLEEMMKENNINLHDMGDKSIGQMDVIISRLRALVASNALANLIPKELKDDAENLKVTFDELIANIERMVDTKVGDVRVDRMKKILGVVSTGLGALGLSANTGAIQDAYAKYVEKKREESQVQKELNKAQEEYLEEYFKIAKNHQGDKEEYLKYLNKLNDAQNKYNDAASESGEALKGLKFTSVVAGVQALASAFDKLGSSISKLGDAKNDESMKETGETISSISNAVSSAASASMAGFIIGGPIGAAIGGGLSIISSAIGSIFDSYAKAEKYNREVAQSSYAWALGVQQVRNEYALLQEQLDTIFGGSNLAKMAGWRDIIKEQGEAIRKFNSSRAQQLAGMELKTYDYGWWDELWGADDDYDSLKNIVPELFNNDGTLNFDYLDTFKSLKWFEELPDEWQAALNQMAEANKAFEDACDQMKDYLTNIFGEVGASISDSLITAFMETGRVALDTGDILADVAKKFVSDWTEAFLVKNYLQGLGDSINDVWENSALDMDEQISQSIGLLRDSLTAMSDRLPEIQKFYQVLEDQVHWADGAGEELGDAIKTAMVEQNSSLMAGYLNSIRADVTMQRNEIMRNISPAVTTISSGITEHFRTVASIEGNVSRIWSRIDLLTSPGSGVRINAKI